MKIISVMIPTFNEVENVEAIANAVVQEIEKLEKYDYEILFIDNNSTDGTRDVLRKICAENTKIKAIFNSRNFGQNNSPYYGLQQTTGDCAIAMSADFQDPVEMIPRFVREWEMGYQVVTAVKTASKESSVIRFSRTIYYRMLKKLSDTEIIEHFTGFGLYDRSFLEFIRSLDDPMPFMRGVVAEFGGKRKMIPFEQPKRRAGKSHNNFFSLYDIAMLSFTSYTSFGLRIATFFGGFIGLCAFIMGIVYLILKLVKWDTFDMGIAPMVIGLFFLGGVQLIFLGLMGEYLIAINQRVRNRPLVIEAERINFMEEPELPKNCRTAHQDQTDGCI